MDLDTKIYCLKAAPRWRRRRKWSPLQSVTAIFDSTRIMYSWSPLLPLTKSSWLQIGMCQRITCNIIFHWIWVCGITLWLYGDKWICGPTLSVLPFSVTRPLHRSSWNWRGGDGGAQINRMHQQADKSPRSWSIRSTQSQITTPDSQTTFSIFIHWYFCVFIAIIYTRLVLNCWSIMWRWGEEKS